MKRERKKEVIDTHKYIQTNTYNNMKFGTYSGCICGLYLTNRKKGM